jgi:[ribosomal protein S18]-alanine N-acetyltransferase
VFETSVGKIQIRPAQPQDLETIRYLIDHHDYYHHHLDWLVPVDWLGRQPFFLLSIDGEDAAALACPADEEGIAWIRLFVTQSAISFQVAWNSLWAKIDQAATGGSVRTVAGLAFSSWFEELLIRSGFSHFQDVVSLSTKNISCLENVPNQEVLIQPATKGELPQIVTVDERAFPSLWRHPLPIMQAAYDQAGYTSVAKIGDEIVGYQLSTLTSSSAHLARLAVDPHFQNRGVGRSLVNDLFHFCVEAGVEELTVNTQSDNAFSLALYRKMGFSPSGEKYPVWIIHLP